MEKQQKKEISPEATISLAELYIRDAEFRAEFDKDPKAAIATLSGEPLPSDVEIVVHRNESNRWHVTLPSAEMVEALSGEMGDKDLENISGGTPRHWSIGIYVIPVGGGHLDTADDDFRF